MGRPVSVFADGLTNRQIDVLKLIAAGMSNIEISIELGISAQTVKNHVTHILAAMQAYDRTDVVCKAVWLGVVDIEAAYRLMMRRKRHFLLADHMTERQNEVR